MNGESHENGGTERACGPALALVLWDGHPGGAETLSVALAEHLRRLGADVTIVFVQQPCPLAQRLATADVPYRSLGLKRGRDLLRRPRRYAHEVGHVGRDGALLVECGFIGAALRAGGYRGRIVAVEHGSLLQLQRLSITRRLRWRIGRLSGAWADHAEVAVSDYLLGRMRQYSHTGRLLRIYNGIDPGRFHPAEGRLNPHTQSLVVGFAGRLVPGKGADHLIRAFAQASEEVSVELLIAGDGPDRSALEVLAKTLRGASRVRFLGVVDDTPAFWRSCDVAAVASDEFVESFSMTTLEAMASGKAIVATRNGAIPELVVDGVTGTLVPPGNVDALARAIVVYAQRPGLRRAHGEAARSRAIDRFHIEDCARAYLDLFRDLRAGPTSKSADSSMP